jgi:cytochrome c553
MFFLVSLLSLEASHPTSYNMCISCHGKDGKNTAFGYSDVIAGWPVEKTKQVLHRYRNGGYRGNMRDFMVCITAPLTQKDLQEIAHALSLK